MAFLVAGVSSLGALMDNWLDVVYVIVQNVLGWSSTACSPLTPPFLGSSQLSTTLFEERRTAVVGLTSLLMAVTDGSIVAYYGRGNTRVANWQAPVNISYGVAAVTYSQASNIDVTGLSSSAYTGSTKKSGQLEEKSGDITHYHA